MDDQQARRINEAAQEFAQALVESYRTATGRAVSAQELAAELTQNFFDSVISNLRSQTESNLAMIQELADQQQRQQEAVQALAQESTNAYMDFLDSMFLFYRRSVEETERSVERSVEVSPEVGPEVSPEGRADGGLPLEDYDSLNVREVSERLDELSVEELRQLRDYEARNKNRRTLLERLDNRIEAGS
jgi:hypothetical protein